MTPPHKTLGKYQILEELGKGGFATVFRALDMDLERDVALKVLDPLLTRDPVWVERFRQEARAVARLDSPRIVTIYEVGDTEGVLFIAMKLVEGGGLDERITAGGAMPWSEVVQTAGQIAEALDYAHEQGVLHRDLKPANVLLDPRSGAVLTDFGFARIVADHSLSVSMSGGVVGTPAYIAPEIWEGEKATAQTDIYALGCILYEMVTGKELFIGATPPAVMLAHFQPPALPDNWPDDVPLGLTEVLGKTLAREPDQRYATAGAQVEALKALNVDHLAKPYAQLEQTIAGENWQQALTLIADIKAAGANYRDVAALEQKALAGAEEETRQAKLEQLKMQTELALTEGDWQRALIVVDEFKALCPDNKAAAGLEQQALAGMEEDAKKQQAAQWQEAVETALVAGNLQAANLALAQWEGLGVEDERIAAYRKRIEDEREAVARLERKKEEQKRAVQASAVAAKPVQQSAKKKEASAQTSAVMQQPPTQKTPPTGAIPQEASSGFKWVYLIPIVLAVFLGGLWISNSTRPTPTPVVLEKIVEVTVEIEKEVERIIEQTVIVEIEILETTPTPSSERSESINKSEATLTPTSAPMNHISASTETDMIPGGFLEKAMYGDFAGTTVTVDGPFVDADVVKFNGSMKAFEEATGIDVQYVGNKEFLGSISIRVDAGDAPDIADFPQPGLLANFVRQGKIIDPTEWLPQEWLEQQYNQSWLEMAEMGGQTAGVWHRFNGKSLVWYPKDDWDAAGYEIPTTWDEMTALMDIIVSDGDAPWCEGIESGAATGWPATDWLEEIMLRTTSLENYDAWTTGDLAFSSPEVKNAAERLAEIWFNPDYVYGGRDGIVSTFFGDSPAAMFEDSPECWMVKHGNWIIHFFPRGTRFGINYDVFYLPPIDEQYGKPFLVAGNIMAMFNDRPEVRALMEYFTKPESVSGWLDNGGALATHLTATPDMYGQDMERSIAELIQQATSFRFDGSDLMPGEVGSGSFWKGMTDWVSGAKDLDTTLNSIDSGWPVSR